MHTRKYLTSIYSLTWNIRTDNVTPSRDQNKRFSLRETKPGSFEHGAIAVTNVLLRGPYTSESASLQQSSFRAFVYDDKRIERKNREYKI